MLSRVDASELALQLHHYLDALKAEALRDFAVLFGSRLTGETRALFFSKLHVPLDANLRRAVSKIEKHRLTFAIASMICGDQASIDAIPSLVRQSLPTYRAFVLTEEIVEPARRRRNLAAASLCAICAIAILLVVFAPYRPHPAPAPAHVRHAVVHK